VYFDTHAHLSDPAFADDLAEVIGRAKAAGVERILAPAVDLATSRRNVELAAAHPGLLAAVGVHPESVRDLREGWLEELEDVIELSRPAALGEIGLDGFHADPPIEDQIPILRAQVRLAARHELPLILHSRRAGLDVLRVMDDEGFQGGGVFHCAEDDEVLARAILNAGFHLGFGGTLTYPRNDVLRRIVGRLPRERLLIETDCPYLAPQPERGKRNEPAFVVHVAEVLAGALGISSVEVGDLTTANAVTLFVR
jgi:TatD DNase family protein